MLRYYLFKIYFLIKYAYHIIFTPFYKIGWRVAFCKGVEVNNSGYIQLGSKIFIGKNALIGVDILQHKKFGTHKPKLKIGNNVSIGKDSYINAISDIEIESDTYIAPNCYISDSSHRYKRVDIPILKQGLDKAHPIRIKNGSWIGWGVVVMPGVTIGKNSVVGANSVVTKDVPDYCVAVGAPAKVIKKYDFETKKWVKVD